MIVWGGITLLRQLNTAVRYNPATTEGCQRRRERTRPRRVRAMQRCGRERRDCWGGSAGASLNTGLRVYNRLRTHGLRRPSRGSAETFLRRRPHAAAHMEGGRRMIRLGRLFVDRRLSIIDTGGRFTSRPHSWTADLDGERTSGRAIGVIAFGRGRDDRLGGYAANYMDSGGALQASTDSWTATSTGANVPAGDLGSTAVWTGTR
jgi:hypothetical protein